MAVLARFKQEIDAGAGRAARVFGHPGLAKMAAFGVRREVEVGDDLVWGHFGAMAGARCFSKNTNSGRTLSGIGW